MSDKVHPITIQLRGPRGSDPGKVAIRALLRLLIISLPCVMRTASPSAQLILAPAKTPGLGRMSNVAPAPERPVIE